MQDLGSLKDLLRSNNWPLEPVRRGGAGGAPMGPGQGWIPSQPPCALAARGALLLPPNSNFLPFCHPQYSGGSPLGALCGRGDLDPQSPRAYGWVAALLHLPVATMPS